MNLPSKNELSNKTTEELKELYNIVIAYLGEVSYQMYLKVSYQMYLKKYNPEGK
jgi:23S rRNA maturation mini-RNase III